MDNGYKLGLLLMYAGIVTYTLLMLCILAQLLFRAAIENYRRRQSTQKHAEAAYTFRALAGKCGWATIWPPRDPEPNQPAPYVKVTGRFGGAGPTAKQSIVLASIILVFGLASAGVAQRSNPCEVSASALSRQLIDIESKETPLRMRLEEIDQQLKPEGLEAAFTGSGSVHPEELREHRRKLLIIERKGLQTQLDLLEEDRARIERAIAEADNAAYLQSAQPLPTPSPKQVTETATDNIGAVNLPFKKSLIVIALLPFVASGSILLLIAVLRRTRLRHYPLLILLFAQFFLPMSARSQQPGSIRTFAKGHGSIVSAFEERKFSSVLVVLRQDGQAWITLDSDLQLQAKGTWSATASSPEEIQLKITGGELNGNGSATGKLLLNDDRTSLCKLTITGRSLDGREMTLRFIADPTGLPQTAYIDLISSPGLQ